MDCKVIYEFDLSLGKTFHCLLFHLSERRVESGEIVWFGFGTGKATLCKGVIGDRFMFINYTIYTIHA